MFTVGLLPANWLLEFKRWRRRRVTHNTTLSHNISSHAHPSTSTCFRVSAGCQTAGWLTSRAGVYGGWVVAAAIDLWSASFSSWGGQPCPRQPAPVSGKPTPSQPQPAARRCLESTTEGRQPPLPRGRPWTRRMRIQFEEEWLAK